MRKILGIDTGTNSLGWAIVERNDNNEYRLLEHNSYIFQEGVKNEKGIESSKAAEKTDHKHLRVRFWRRKTRKTRLLTILVENNMCPPLSKQEIRDWRLKGIYPKNEEFINWQLTHDKKDLTPYAYRNICLTQKLDLSNVTQRYILGRALYHINQRRGFLSNRKDQTEESEETGKVKNGINELTDLMAQSNCKYLGQYFYKLYLKGEKIRNHYTARNEHYLAEFNAICQMQQINEDLQMQLRKAIFTQRPLKSQKQQIGKCTFEPQKSRCPISHPLYEEYRMYCFINNIKVKKQSVSEYRRLDSEEINKIKGLFYRKSKSTFKFEDIAKEIAGKNNYVKDDKSTNKEYAFNFPVDTQVSGCPVTSQLIEIFGEDWITNICEVYTLAQGKTTLQIINDIWHVLFSFSDNQHIAKFAREKLQLSEEQSKKFSEIKIPQDYSPLSLKAICNILPYLKDWGLSYSNAVFLGALYKIAPKYEWSIPQMRDTMIELAINVMQGNNDITDTRTKEQRLKDFLHERYNVPRESLKMLYHPSMIESYPKRRSNDDGIYQLGSPRINSVRNPMAMRSLFCMRKVLNTLLKEGKIDEETEIHIEFSRDLNDTNRRAALRTYQQDNEKRHIEIRKKIIETFESLGMKYDPTDNDILKYELWEEQGQQCLYTGKTIGITEFLGANPQFDIEHTIPQSAGGDSTKMNLTLCDSRFNREVKKAQLPAQLSNHADILARIEVWKEKVEDLNKAVRKYKGGNYSSKEIKDNIIKKRHRLSIERDYWRGKFKRFTMTEVPEGFARRQGHDNCIISKYARLFLKSVFRNVHTIRGIATSDFRKAWGIQDIYAKKERVNHAHHCIDAIVIACITPHEYAQLAAYYKSCDDARYGVGFKTQMAKPWPSFVEDIKQLHEHLLIAHHTAEKMPKQAKRRIMTPDGKIMALGDTARGSLHLDSYYGAIRQDGDVKYVIRKSLDSIDDKDIKNIVDPVVKSIVESVKNKHGNLKKAIESDDVWMNQEKGVRIRKVRLYAPKVTRPINIRYHRDESRHEYKRQFHVSNDFNYAMVIYSCKDAKGKERRQFHIINNLNAAKHFRRSNPERYNSIIPEFSDKGYPLAYCIKPGDMVLLYESKPQELYDADISELQRRLYKISGISGSIISGIPYGTITMTHSQEARPSSQIKAKNGAYLQGEALRPSIAMLHTQINVLVEGTHFIISPIGEISWIKS